jgi:glycosyltransferase involved in cell wall biosynthesis
MQKPTLHLPGLFHTINNQEYSHCAFTGKVLRFPKMMQMQGYRVYDYSNEGSESRASRYFQILSKEEMGRLGAFQEGTAFHGNKATCGSPLHAAFEKGLIKNMIDHVVPGDIVCHPFGIAHERLLAVFPEAFHVETGIGYDRCVKDTYRIFESEAWRHTHIEREKRAATNYEWVIPNYYDLDDWTPSEAPGTYVAFMGRICEAKGMNTVLEMAKRGVRIKVAGQGDPGAWSHRNIDYVGPLKGRSATIFFAAPAAC